VQEVASRIKRTGIDAPHILLSATHSHSSVGAIWPADNNGYAFVGGDAFDPRVFDSTAQGIAEAIIAANSRLKPARIGFGVARADGASRNRSFDAFKRNTDIPKDPEGQRAASVDPTVTVLRVDHANGAPMALWSNFAVHPTSFGDGNLLFSGDNAGIAARLAEAAISREKRARVVDVWTNGAQGDISPAGESDVDWTNTDAAKADEAGARDAAGIVAAWRDAGRHMDASTPVGSRSFFFAFDGSSYGGPGGKSEPVTPYPVLGQGGIVQDDGTCAPVDNLAGPGQGQKLPLVGGPGLARPHGLAEVDDGVVVGVDRFDRGRPGPDHRAARPSERPRDGQRRRTRNNDAVHRFKIGGRIRIDDACGQDAGRTGVCCQIHRAARSSILLREISQQNKSITGHVDIFTAIRAEDEGFIITRVKQNSRRAQQQTRQNSPQFHVFPVRVFLKLRKQLFAG
jgi:hypothetical protein